MPANGRWDLIRRLKVNPQSKPSALFISSVVLTSNKDGCLSVSGRYRNLSVQTIRPGDALGTQQQQSVIGLGRNIRCHV